MSVEGIGDIIVPTVIRHYDAGTNYSDGRTFETTLRGRFAGEEFDFAISISVYGHCHEVLP